MNIDLTPFFQALIVLMAAIITHKLVPYIKTRTNENQFRSLTTAANVVVYAAEQIFQHGENDRKLEYAVEVLRKGGFDLNTDTIRAAVEKAVRDMKKPDIADVLQGLQVPDDMEIPPLEDWPLDMIQRFCADNDIPCAGCETKEEYIAAIIQGGSTAEPEDLPEGPAGD